MKINLQSKKIKMCPGPLEGSRLPLGLLLPLWAFTGQKQASPWPVSRPSQSKVHFQQTWKWFADGFRPEAQSLLWPERCRQPSSPGPYVQTHLCWDWGSACVRGAPLHRHRPVPPPPSAFPEPDKSVLPSLTPQRPAPGVVGLQAFAGHRSPCCHP